MHETLVEALREGESNFRGLLQGSFLKPSALASAIYWCVAYPKTAGVLLQEFIDGESQQDPAEVA